MDNVSSSLPRILHRIVLNYLDSLGLLPLGKILSKPNMKLLQLAVGTDNLNVEKYNHFKNHNQDEKT